MIGDGLFRTQLNEIETILEQVGILEERQQSPNKGLGAARFRGMSYREVYEESVREFAYDFRLSDQSLLLFIKSGNNQHDGSLNYCYLECPVKVWEYREFVGNEIGLSIMDENFDSEVDSWGDEMRANYEQYVSSMNSKSSVTPLRYDYKATDYRPGVHPASHVHFGHDNDIRVGTKRIMMPLSFAFFVLRQHYPRKWEQVRQINDMVRYVRNVRDNLVTVTTPYWNAQDDQEIFLH